jgi:hypothetical protein
VFQILLSLITDHLSENDLICRNLVHDWFSNDTLHHLFGRMLALFCNIVGIAIA